MRFAFRFSIVCSVIISCFSCGAPVSALPQVGHSQQIASLAFSRDGAWLASGGLDSTVLVWKVSTHSLEKAIMLDGMVEQVGFSASGRYLAASVQSGSGTYVRIWETRTWRPVRTLGGQFFAFHPKVDEIAVDGVRPESTPTFTNSQDPSVFAYLYDIAAGKRRATYSVQPPVEKGEVGVPVQSRLAFDKDGVLLIGTLQSQVRVFSVNSGKEVRVLSSVKDPLTCLSFSPGNGMIVAGSRAGKIYLWNANTGKAIKTFAAHDDPVSELAFRSSDNLLITAASISGSIQYAHGRTLKSWNLADGAEIMKPAPQNQIIISPYPTPPGKALLQVDAKSQSVYSIAVTSNGNLCACVQGVSGNDIELWDLKTDVMTATLHGNNSIYSGLVFSDNDKAIKVGVGSAVDFKGVLTWRLDDGAPANSEKYDWSQACVLSSDGDVAAGVGFDQQYKDHVRVYDTHTRQLLQDLQGRWPTAISGDGRFLLYGANSLKVVNCRTGASASFGTVKGSYFESAFSIDGAMVATATDLGGDVWNSETGDHICALPKANYSAVAFNPADATLAAGLREPYSWEQPKAAEIDIFNARLGSLIGILPLDKPGGTVNHVAYTADGHRLLASYSDGMIRVWNLSNMTIEATFDSHFSDEIAVSHDGKLVAGSNSREISVWSISSGHLIRTLSGFGPAN